MLGAPDGDVKGLHETDLEIVIASIFGCPFHYAPRRKYPRLSSRSARRWSRTLEPEILVGRRVGVAPDQVDPGLLDPRTDAPDERELVDRHVGHAIVEDLLDLVQQRLPLLRVELARLTLEEVLDLRKDAGGVDPALAHVRLEARGGVAASASNADDYVL